MSVTDRLLENNSAYAAGFTGPLPLPPAKGVVVVACMDARLDIYRILGLHEGEAHVIRNAGGVITDDEIRSSIAALLAADLVEKEPDPNDGRRELISIGPAGRQALALTAQQRDRDLADIFDKLSDADRATIRAFLDLLTRITADDEAPTTLRSGQTAG